MTTYWLVPLVLFLTVFVIAHRRQSLCPYSGALFVVSESDLALVLSKVIAFDVPFGRLIISWLL